MPARKAKAAANAAPGLILTAPKKGAAAKKSGKDRLSITGHEKLATTMRERQKKMDSLDALQKTDKKLLTDDVKAKRLAAEKAGDFHSTVLVESEDGKPAQIVFQDRYAKVDVEHEDALRSALSGNFETLFKKGVSVKVTAGKTLADFEEALGDKFADFLKLVDCTEFLSPGKGYMQKRAALRPGLDDATNDAIDAITDQVQVTPSVKLK